MRLFFILLLAPMAAVALDLTDQQRADIEARIQPFSAVCVQGETCGGGSDAVASQRRSLWRGCLQCGVHGMPLSRYCRCAQGG